MHPTQSFKQSLSLYFIEAVNALSRHFYLLSCNYGQTKFPKSTQSQYRLGGIHRYEEEVGYLLEVFGLSK